MHESRWNPTNCLLLLLSQSPIRPDEFAYNLMGQPGFPAVHAGEVVYVLKCEPKQYEVELTSDCFQDIPVKTANGTQFLAAKTQILTRYSPPASCHPLFGPQFNVSGAWYSPGKKWAIANPPTILDPNSPNTWRAVTQFAIGSSGIYSTA